MQAREWPLKTIAVLTLVLLASPASADFIVMTDGRVFEFDRVEKEAASFAIHFKDGKVQVPLALVRSHYKVSKAGDYEPQTDEEKAKVEKGLLPYQGKWLKKSKALKQYKADDDARRARVEQMKERRKWRNHVTVKTKRFVYKHTLPDEVFEEYKDLFETYYKFFTKYWGIKPSRDFGTATINIYHDRAYFEQVGGIGGGVVGWYMPKNRDLNFYVDRENKRYTIDVMFHEGNHMLTHMINEKFWYPWWVGEGMAEYFGASSWDARKKKMTIGLLQSGRLAVLKEQFSDEDKRLKLQALLETRGMGAVGYAWAWSFCHFMLSTPQYEKKFKKFYVALGKAKGIKRVARGMGSTTVQPDELVRVFKKYLKVDDIEALQKEWYEYIDKVLTLDRDQKLDWGMAGYIMSLYGERAKARKFFKRAIDGGSKDAFVLYGYAELKLIQNMPGIALKYATLATEADPLHARAWCLRGQALNADGKRDEGIKFVRIAREMDPESQEIWFVLESMEQAEKDAKEKK